MARYQPSRQPARQPQGKHVSSRLAKALGFPSASPGAAVIRELMGLHQPPERMLRYLERFPDSLSPPRIPRWQVGEVTSPYDLAFGDVAHVDQLIVRTLREQLGKGQLPEAWLGKLKRLQAFYPEVPLLWNLEISYYRSLGQIDSWRACAEQTLERFPGYLYAACSLASYWLSKDQPDKVLPIFGDEYELEDFDPLERVFEASEVSAFYGTMAWHHLFKRRILRACLCIAIIHEARPNDPFLDNLTGWLMMLPERTLVALQQTLRSK